MIWDPYKNKLNILVNKCNDQEKLREYILDRISGKSNDPSINFGHGEQPEQFLIWAYDETEDESFKSNFSEASKDILSQLLLELECQKNRELLSRILYVATKCNITQVLNPLKDKIIKNDVYLTGLLRVDVTYSTDLLKQSLFAIITLQPRGDSKLRNFWMQILKSNKPKGFRALALQGLEKFMGLDAITHFHYYLEDLAKSYQEAGDKDDVVLETAGALNFFFKSKSPDGETLFNRPELLLNNIYIVSNSLETFWVVAKLVEDSLSYLLERNDVFVDKNTKVKWEDVVCCLQNDRKIMEHIVRKPRISYSDRDFSTILNTNPSPDFEQYFMKSYFEIKPAYKKRKDYMMRRDRSLATLRKDTEELKKNIESCLTTAKSEKDLDCNNSVKGIINVRAF